MEGLTKLSAPITVFLNITNQCNLMCTYCSANATPSYKDDLTPTELLSLINTLSRAKVFRIVVTGGEPFIRGDIFDILKRLSESHVVSINSNGTLINEAIAQKLSELRIRKIAISLDGSSEEINSRTRGRESFAKAMQGIKNLLKKDIMPTIVFTPTKYNYGDLPNVVNLMKSMGLKAIAINKLLPIGRCESNYRSLSMLKDDQVEFIKILKELKKKRNDVTINEQILHWYTMPERLANITRNSNKNLVCPQKLLPCSAAKDQCAVTADGWVIPCNNFCDIKCGNIRNQNFLDIWKNSPKMNEVRNLANISLAEIPICSNCKFNVVCAGGCRADAYNFYGDLKAPDPHCPYHVNRLYS